MPSLASSAFFVGLKLPVWHLFCHDKCLSCRPHTLWHLSVYMSHT